MRRNSARRYRWVTVLGSFGVTEESATIVQLLSPVQPPGNIADTLYQQMTKPTLIAVMGNVTVYGSAGYSSGTAQDAQFLPYSWGMYVDDDVNTSTTSLTPFSQANTSDWIVHKTGIVSAPGYLPTGTANSFFADTNLTNRRYDLNLRKYKRTMDSYNDTLVFAVETGSRTGENINLGVYYYFRMLLLE